MSESKYKYHGIYDLAFYKCDEDSNMETNEDGSIKLYTSEQNIDLSDVSDWFDTEDLIEDNFDDFTSASTSKQQTQAHPHMDTIKMTTKEMKELLKKNLNERLA